MCDIHAGLEARGALSVEGLDGGCFRETGNEGGGAVFGCAGAGGEDVADGDVFDEVGVNFRAGDDGFEGMG